MTAVAATATRSPTAMVSIVVLALLYLAADLGADTLWRNAKRNEVRDICYGDGRFVAVGRSGSIHWSTDGVHWWAGKAVGFGYLEPISDVCFGDGRFVAVGADGRIVWSIDGRQWEHAMPPTPRDLFAIGWGQGKFVAAGDNGLVFSSSDGVSWAGPHFTDAPDHPEVDEIAGVAYGDGIWVLVARSNTRGAYSTDGVNWTKVNVGGGRSKKLLFAGGHFAAVGDGSGSTAVLRSADGMNWSRVDAPENLTSIAYHPGHSRWVVASESGTFYHSSNLINWTASSATEPESVIGYGGGKFCALGQTHIASSSDGLTWDVAPGGDGTGLSGGCWHGGRFVVVGRDGVVGHYDLSTDAVTLGTSPFDHHWSAAASNGTRCVAISDTNGRVISSADGLTWVESNPPSFTGNLDIQHLFSKFCITTTSGEVHLSSDGQTWETEDFGDHATLVGIAHDGTRALALDKHGDVWSADSTLKDWTVRSEISDTLADIAYSDGKFVAISGFSDSYVSDDGGLTWSAGGMVGERSVLDDLGVVDGHFIAVKVGDGRMFSSPDGAVWTEVGTGVEVFGELREVVSGGGGAMVFGERGWHLISKRRLSTDDQRDLRFDLVTDDGGDFEFSVDAAAGESGLFRIEGSVDAEAWSPLLRDLTPDSHGVLYRGTNPHGGATALFRVREED